MRDVAVHVDACKQSRHAFLNQADQSFLSGKAKLPKEKKEKDKLKVKKKKKKTDELVSF